MKMIAEDFARLGAAVRPVMVSVPWSNYVAKGLPPERWRWDCLHASGLQTGGLYSYLSDDHIDTALRAIASTLGGAK